MSTQAKNKSNEQVIETVRAGYAEIAMGKRACCYGSPRSSQADPTRLAQAVGYDAESLANLPEGANMGLSCGNPVAIAALREGQTVLDLGSGGGFDVFQAGEKVKDSGRVIGVDMTPEMLAKARKNIAHYRQRTGLDNVEFRLGEIEYLPVADSSVDVVLSNCVINLSPDKPQVWREISRVLKPGGKISVSDLALLKPLPDNIREMAAALVGCVAGAVLVEETRAMLEKNCFKSIVLTPKPDYVRSMQDWNDPLYKQIAETLPQDEEMADYIVSLSIEARKYTDDDLAALRGNTLLRAQKAAGRLYRELCLNHGLEQGEISAKTLALLHQQTQGADTLERFLLLACSGNAPIRSSLWKKLHHTLRMLARRACRVNKA
ncbi:MAG: arsenite methyltransferase [Desulfovibrio sp.]|jgi:SAM-dependent methyltransferase|nr:arsenite methyltransferase [Desulfovibrio sp.]